MPDWLRGPLANWAKHQIFESPLATRGFFNREYVDDMWNRHLTGRAGPQLRSVVPGQPRRLVRPLDRGAEGRLTAR